MNTEVGALSCCSDGLIGGGQTALVRSAIAMLPMRILWLTCLASGWTIEKIYCGWREHKGWKPAASDAYLIDEPQAARGLEFDSILSPGRNVHLQIRNLTDEARRFRAYLAVRFPSDRKLVPSHQFSLEAPHSDVDLPWIKGNELILRSEAIISQDSMQVVSILAQHTLKPLKLRISDDRDWEIEHLQIGLNRQILCEKLPAESFREIAVPFDVLTAGYTLSLAVRNLSKTRRYFEAFMPFETFEAQPPKMMGDLITETPELT